MKNDPNSNNVMVDFYRAPIIVSALITLVFLLSPSAYAGGPINTEVASGTTTYSVTNRTISHPVNTTVSAARDITPYVSKVPNGLAQSAAGDLIVATKKGDLSARFTGKFVVPTPALKLAAKSALRSAPYISYGMIAYEGIEAIANANGWYINWSTDQLMQMTPSDFWRPDIVQFTDVYPPNANFDFPFQLQFTDEGSISIDLLHILQSLNCRTGILDYDCVIDTGGNYFQVVDEATAMVLPILGPLLQDQVIACSVLIPNPAYPSCYFPGSHLDINIYPVDTGGLYWEAGIYFKGLAYYSHVPMQNWETGQVVDHSPYGVGRNNYTAGYAPSDSGGESPVTHEQLEQAIDSQYEPYPSDWDAFFDEPDFVPDSYVLDPIPAISGEPDVSTSTDSITGNTSVSSTATDLAFTVTNPPSGIPEITITEVSQDKEFVNGDLVKDNTTETTRPPIPVTNQPPSPGGSGTGSSSGSGLELPSFCSWASIVCGFIDWAQQEPFEPEDNLSELINEVEIFNEMYPIVAPDAACPAPLVLDLSQFGSREVSYQPLCDLASTMKFLYLTLMSFAAAVLLHRSISRV